MTQSLHCPNCNQELIKPIRAEEFDIKCQKCEILFHCVYDNGEWRFWVEYKKEKQRS